MRKKLDTRFPAARIKKIMQADEEIGKIAMAVPLLVSKALELFLQDLCDRTYEMTVKKGAKTVNSLHLKQCVQSFNMFDFLKDTVSRVPDLGGSDAPSEDKSTIKRRKNSDDEELVNDDESKRARLNETGQASSTGRSRGRGRGRGRGRRSGIDRELTDQHVKSEDIPEMHPQNGEAKDEHEDRSYNVADVTEPGTTEAKGAARTVRDFDLNMDLDENGEYVPTFEEKATIESLPKPSHDDKKHEDISGSSLDEMENIAMQPSHDDMRHEDISGPSLGEMENMAMHHPIPLAGFNGVMDEEYEDYDEEE